VVIGLSGAFGVMAIIRAEANAPFFRAGFSWSTIIVAVVSAVAVGLVFGTYPALRAARMSPIEAIRHE
jgi:putative ABC transport system permease protein